MLDRLAGKEFYCFLDGCFGYNQIVITPKDQEKTIFTCPYGTLAFKRMPFGLCNAPWPFFPNIIESSLEYFMDDFSNFGESFKKCMDNLELMLTRCEENNLVLNWEKCHFTVKEGIVLCHKISKKGLEVDQAKVEVTEKLPPPMNIKGIRSFLSRVGFYIRFIKNFSKITKPLCQLLQYDVPYVFS